MKSRIALAELIEQLSRAPKPKDINQKTWNIELTNLDTKEVEVFQLKANNRSNDWDVVLSA